jgi:hypothetical protein
MYDYTPRPTSAREVMLMLVLKGKNDEAAHIQMKAQIISWRTDEQVSLNTVLELPYTTFMEEFNNAQRSMTGATLIDRILEGKVRIVRPGEYT